ncbi:MAG: leucine-rich repeat domain-containing protein, partial [Clostridia bacterium]|nr:leucine-rich repeat domain-containing protein [Clostridia bacterium]
LVTTARDGSVPVTFEFNDCTLTMFDGSNATFRRCLFTDSYYYDGMNPFQNVFVYDSAILDKAPVNYDKEMHTDGVQIYGYQGLEAKNLHFDNLRVELPIVYYTDSYALGNTPFMISLDYNNAQDISFTNCIANGGGNMIVLYDNPKHKDPGYKMTDIVLSNIRTGANYTYGSFSTVLENSVMGEDILVENLTKTTTLYVASIWQENGETHFSVSNDTAALRTLVIMTDRGTYTYEIPACPLFAEVLKDTFYSSFPFDIDLAIPEACEYAVLYDVTGGTYEQIRSFSATGEPITIDADRFEELYLPEDGVLVHDGGIGASHGKATWTLKRDGTLVISGDCALGNYATTTGASRKFHPYADQIKRVVIEPGITHIGNAFFYSLPNLTEIIIPSTVKSIGDYAFQGCTSLKQIDLPYGLEKLGSYAFRGCTSLESIHIPSTVTSLGNRMFGNCSALLEVTIACPTAIVGTGMFDGCSALESVSLPATVETIEERAFYRCAAMKTVFFAGTEEQLAAITVENEHNYNKGFVEAEAVFIKPADLTEGEDVEFGKDEPKAPTLTLKDTLTKIYDGSPCESIPYFETNSDGQVTVTFAKGATQLSSPPTAAGRYVVIIDTAATDTYKAARASVSFYIHKITPFL